MPWTAFVVKEQFQQPGMRDRLVCYSPFVKPVVDSLGRPAQMFDDFKTWQALQGAGYFPAMLSLQQVDYYLLKEMPGSPLNVVCDHIVPLPVTAVPTVVNAVTANPTSNRGQYGAAVPIADVPSGTYATLPDAALPSNDDPIMGNLDPTAGTYSDISPVRVGNGQYEEQQRDHNNPGRELGLTRGQLKFKLMKEGKSEAEANRIAGLA